NRGPLFPFEAIAPGQPASALAFYPCNLRAMPAANEERAYCEITPQGQPFERIIAVGDEHQIERLILEVKSGGLYLRDLMRCFGKPTGLEVLSPSYTLGSMYVYWGKETYAVIHAGPPHNYPSHLLPVAELVMGSPWHACTS